MKTVLDSRIIRDATGRRWWLLELDCFHEALCSYSGGTVTSARCPECEYSPLTLELIDQRLSRIEESLGIKAG